MYPEGKYVNCVCSECDEGGCRLDLSGMTDQVVILDMNCVRQAGRICDCGILFNREKTIAAVELKGGHQNAERLAEQIQGGLNALDDVVKNQHVSKFYPILMYKKSKRDPSRGLAGVGPMRFRGMKRSIMAYPCGTRLLDILDGLGRRRRRRNR